MCYISCIEGVAVDALVTDLGIRGDAEMGAINVWPPTIFRAVWQDKLALIAAINGRARPIRSDRPIAPLAASGNAAV